MNRKQIFVALVMVIVFISAISLVCASENADNATMTSNTDNSAVSQATNVDENILGETPKSFDELNDVIQNGSVSAGGTILLNHNYTYSQSDSVGIDGIRINRDITIDGQGYTLDGAGESSIFRITGDSHVILKNINFVNGHGSSGGAIRFSSYENVEIYNSNFTNNSASVSGGAIYIYSAGSISLNSKIVNSTFTNNVAATGGAISASGTLTSVVSSNFYYNNATNNGGSLFLDVGAYVDRCLFEHGHAANDGGAIYLNSVVGEDSTIDDSILEKLGVFNSVMVDCSAGRNGGAGYINANKGTVRNVTFAYNTAGGSGGAGYVSGSNGKLIGSRFINNTAANDGGAVMWIGLNGTIQSVTIINNTATEGNGGGIYLHPSDAVSAFSGISIVNMSTFNHNTAGQYGGALYCGGIFSIIRNSTFTYDEAYDGAGIYLDVGAAIANCNFFKESASNDGGAIYLSASNSDISSVSPELLAVFINYVGVRHSSIINCSAGHDGGAGYVRGNYGVVNNVTMTNNYAGHDGGAGYVAGDYGVLSNSRMINNAAGHDGGALMWVGNGGNATSINCMLNLARGGSGGSIYISGTNVSLSKSNFSLSNATFSGGALYVAGDNVNVSQSLFDKCAANALHGGAMYVSGSNATIQKSNFTMNRVNMGIGQGGSINIQGDDAEISECYFDRCTASQGGLAYINGTGVIIENTVGNRSFAVNGGAFYINGDNVTIRNSNVSLTNATTSGGALYVEGDFANITNVDFSQCIAYTGSGGAIYINGLNTTISESDFVQNIVPGQTARGGSIYVQGNGTKILNSDFDKCTAFEGGVIYVNGSYVTIDGYSCNRSFAKNNGGAIYVMGDNVTVSNFNMSNTNATNYGGALYIAGNFANVSNSNFTRCIADNYHGGAMYIAGLNTTISNSNFAQNKVNTDSGRGGSIDVQGDGAKILNCTFDRCTAFEGGVIYVNGSNVIIDGYSCNRSLATNNGGAIYVAGDYVTISDFDISHTNATNYGGALYVTGNHVNITNSNFSRCIAYEGHGGCIFVSGLDAMIANSSFTQNRVAGEKARGGSIDIQGNGTKIVNCNFTMCSAYEGGVVYVNGSNVQINNSIASKTSALNDGGAIYIAGNNVTINNFTSSLSNATTNGGAIYVEGNDTQILNSDFRNTTSLLGAGIYVSGDGIILDNSTFKYNNAIGPYFGGLGGAGGAVYIEGDNGTISNSDFEYSHTYNYGASIYVAGDNTNITGNTFDKCSVDRFNGGAIFVKGLNTTISDSNFTQNIVNVSNFARGGSIDVEGDYTKILNCNFDKCTAYEGGVIYVTGEYLTIDNSNFTKSNAINDGGAIYIAGNDATVSNSNFTLNNATNYGGSIYVAGNNANITGDTFENCTANMYNGGAIYIRGVNTTIEKSNFTRNRVNPANWAHGGAIDVEGDNTTISDSVFDQCMAWDGGVIYVSGDNAVIDNATITHSSAKENGGAIYVAGDYVTVSNSDISMNNATSFGGAIYVAGDNTNIIGNNFTMCIVEYYHGGAIFVLGVNTTIDSSNFLMCNASGSESRGGAIDVHGEGTNITNSHFDKCHANDLGGTIYVDGANVLIDCSTFNRSSANNGGSIYILGHYATISNSNVSYSNATVSGGGIYVEGYFSNITNADFNYCFAITGKGGAIYVAGNNATITDSDFNITRSLNGNGGALYITGNHTDVFNSSFDRCGAINGGVIYVEGYDTDISGDFTNSNSIKDGGTLYIVGEECDVFNSTFINNIAGDDGGAIYWEGSNGAVYNITCVNNKGISSGTSASKGGTICLTGDNASISKASFEDSFSKYNGGTIFITGNNVNITDTEFKDSYVDSSAEITSKDAPYGGALYVLGNNTNVLNCTFDNCTAMHGGVMYVEGNNANINATFKNSNCTKDGGALYVLGLNCTVFDSTFVNNTAGDDGGAIYWEGDGGSIDNISCENNKGISAGTSSSKGGTICLTGDDASISNATFTDSFSNYNGGTIFVTGNNANITDSSFKNSQVNSSAPITSKDEPYGGALCIIGNNTDVLNCTFDNCTALQGGVMYISGHNTTVDESSMKNSLSIKEGGAVYVAGDNATISADFENCNASTDSSSYVGHGGAIYISGDFTNITDSSFEGCYAKNGGDGGAIYIGGLDANVEKSSFNKTGTVSGYGGAIYIDGDQATISDSEINDSFVGRVPGWELNDEGTIVGFTSSLARDGGAIYVKSEGAKIDNVTIMNSNATRNGGAIYVEGSGANISATIINCTSGLPASEVSTNPDDYMSHIDVISECLDAIDTFIDNYGSVSVDKSNELLTYLNNAKGKVSNIFTKVNNVFSLNQANFNYVNNTVALLNSTLQSYKNTGFYNDVMPYIEAIVADLNNISENENYDAFNKVLKNNITNNFNKIINYVTYYKELLTFLDNLQDNVEILKTETDYDVVKLLLTDSKSINDKLKSRATSLRNFNDDFAEIVSYANVIGSEITSTTTIVNGAYDSGIKGDGGAIYVHGVNTNISDSSFENCSSLNGGNGGAIYIGGVNATVNSSDFENCHAEDGGNGGAIYIGGVNATIDQSSFHKTGTVEGYGGAIYVDGNNAVVSHSTFNESFVGRYADLEKGIYSIGRDGGAIYIRSEDAVIEDVTIMFSNATRHGGAIYVQGNDANISANITNCTAGASAVSTSSDPSAYLSHVQVISDNVEDMIDFFNDYGPLSLSELNTLYNSFENIRSNNQKIFVNGAFNQANYDNIVNKVNDINKTLKNYKSYDFYNVLYPYLEAIVSDLNNISENKNYTQFNSVLKTRITNNAISARNFINYYKTITTDWLPSLQNNVATLQTETDYNVIYSTLTSSSNIVSNGNFKDRLNKLIDYDAKFIEISNNLEVVRTELSTTTSIVNSFNDNGISGCGGGIYIAGDNTYLHDSEINNCYANLTAGAVYLGKNTTVIDSSFANNTATYGGAMYNAGNGSRVFTSSFINNTATWGDSMFHGGGAIYWIGGSDDDVIDRCYFENNTAPAKGAGINGALGGAIFWNKGNQFGKGLINNSVFYNNFARRHGGAIDWFQSDGGIINNCTFEENYVGTADGGAVYCGDSNGGGKNFIISNSTFTNNKAVQFGGGISSQMTGAKIINCTFEGNNASYGASIGIKDTYGKNAQIINCTILDSYADGNKGGTGGAAIYIRVDNVTVINTTIINSTAHNTAGVYHEGGAIYWSGSNGKLNNVTIINASGSNGGAIFWSGTNGFVDGVHIYNSTATLDGGAIYWTGTNGKLYNSTLVNNTAKNGGGLYWSGSNPTAYNNTYILNNASQNGGGIYWAVAADITNATLKNNTANQGGGIYWANTGNSVIDSVLIYNKAFRGSGIFTLNNMDIINSTLLENRANSDTLTLMVTRGDADQTLEAFVTFTGNDNIINAIWNGGANSVVGFTNVTYLGVNGTVSNTGSTRRTPTKLDSGVQPSDNETLYQTNYEDHQNITYYIYDNQNNLLYVGSTLTNISGVAHFTYQNTASTDKLHVWAYHPDDNYYTYLEESDSKKLVYIEIPTTDIYYLENETFIINVVPVKTGEVTPTGNISVWFENELIYENIKLVDGKSFQINITGLKVGTYTVNVTYTGDDEYLPRVNSTTFKVMKIPSFIIPTVENYTYGEQGKVIVHIPVNEPNNVTLNINGQDYEVKINESGYGELLIPKLGHGNYTVYAYYPETHNYYESRNSTVFEIYPLYSVVINKTSNISQNVTVGGLVNFTIELYNNGSVNGTNLNVTDKLSKYFQYVSSGSNSTYVGVNSTSDGTEMVTWNIGTLQKDERLKLWLVVRVLMNGTYENVAVVNSTQGLNTSNTVTVNVTPVVDISITKKINVTGKFVNVTDLVMFTITVTNNGPSNATHVVVNDTLIKILKIIEDGITVTNGTYNQETGLWTIDKLNNGTSETLTIIARVVGVGVISNVANVTSAENDTNKSNNNASSENVTALPIVDLNITKTVNVTVANVTDLVNFTITVTNNGPWNATGVYVIDILDDCLKFLFANATKGSYNDELKTWEIGNLGVGKNATLNITVRVTQKGTIPNTAIVRSIENDTNKSNNIAKCEFKALPIVDISINKTVNVTVVNVSDKILYTITVHNNGPCDAHGVYVWEAIDTTYLNVTYVHPTIGRYIGDTWIIDDLLNGSTHTLTIIAKVKTNGTISNFVNVTSVENDTNISNNNYTCKNVTAYPIVDLTINKTVTVAVANVSDEFMYRITVHNNGPSLATGVNVTEKLSPYLELVDSNTWINDYNETGGYWYIGDLEYNATVWLDLYVKVIGNGTISNVVSVTSNENDTNISNNNYTCKNVTAYPVVDLIIKKNVTAASVNVTDKITFTIVVTNNGPSNATKVNVTEVLDSRFRLLENHTTRGNFTGKYWYIGDLANKTNATLTLLVEVKSDGYIENRVEVTSFENDTNPYNNHDMVAVYSSIIYDLQITKTVNVTKVNVTDKILYTITVHNNGPCDAEGVYVGEIFDYDHLRMVGNHTEDGTFDGTWVIGKLANQSTAVLTIEALVINNGTIPNVAIVYSEHDTNKSNNNASSENVTALPIVDLTINKTVTVTKVNVSDEFMYRITVHNNGPSLATGVNVTEILSPYLELLDSNTWINDYNETGGYWYIGDLEYNATVWLDLYVKVIGNGTISNVVSVTSNENDTNKSNNNYTCDNVTAYPIVDLIINKTVNVTKVNVTDLIEFTITVTNKGPSNATHVNITERLSGLLEIVEGGITVSNGTYSPKDGLWTIDLLANGTDATLTIVARVISNGTVSNVVSVTSYENDTNKSNNNASSDNVTALPIVDLKIIKTVNVTVVNVTDLIRFNITVINYGPSNATHVNITERLSGLLEIVEGGITVSNGTYSPKDGLWTIDLLNNGTNATLTIVARVISNGTVSNVVSVTSYENDTNKSNNNASSENVTALPVVDLVISKTVNATKVNVTDLIKFVITVHNNGPSNATDINVTEKLSHYVELHDNVTKFGYYDEGEGIWHIPKLTNGTTATLTLIVKVIGNGTISNVVTVVSHENDTNKSNNNDSSDNVTALPIVDLVISKTVNVTKVNVTDLIKFTITVTNKGPSNATDINVTEKLSNLLEIIGGGINATDGTYTPQNGMWKIDQLNNGTSATLTIVAKVVNNGTISNVVCVASHENDTNKSNNNASSENVTALPIVDLDVSKVINVTGFANISDYVKFTITITNHGPSNATNVIITDKLVDILDIKKFTITNATLISYDFDEGIWIISRLNAGGTAVLTIIAQINNAGTVSNVVNVTSSQNDTNKSNNNASSENVTVVAFADLSITKTVNATLVNVSDLIKFTISVTNNGPNDASGINVTEKLSPYVELVDNSTKFGYYNESEDIWHIPELKNGATATLTLTVRILTNATISNVVSVTSNVNDTNRSNNNASSDNVTALPVVDLIIIKTVNVTKANVTDLIEFTIAVTNNGPSNATGVNVTERLSSLVELVGNVTDFGSYDGSVWNIGNLNFNETATLTLVVRILANGTISNVVSVTSNENDTNRSNNNASSDNVTALPVVDLIINKTVNATLVNVSDLIEFTITVTNNGPSNATHVNITEKLSNLLEIVEGGITISNGTYSPKDGLWTIDLLANGTDATLIIVARIISNGTVSNVVSVTSYENDTNKSNNNASSDNVTALPVVDLIIIKTVNVTKANVTDLIEFTIAVTNNGPSNATGVNVTERLSSLVELIANVTDFGSYDGSVWNICKLNFNETATLTLVVRILANGTISNVVSVTSNENDTNRSNNNASSDNVTALPVVDLFINKTVNATLVNVSDLIEFTIAVTNNGPSNATGVNVTERLSSLVELVGNVTDFGSYDGSVWNIGNLNFNETATLTLTVRILTNGTISNVVTVTSNENDTNRSNNNASSDNVTSLPIVDLSINKTVSTTAAFVGDEIVYVITVHNNGPSNATEVKVTEKLSDSVSLIDNVTAKGYYSENEGIWHVGELANGSTATLTLTVKVIKEGLIENVVVVKSKENDTNKSNNEYPCDNVSVEKINAPIDLETQNITYGEDEIITVTLPVNATGFVNITINNKTYPDVPINNGIVELTVPDLAGGDYDVIVVYGGDGKYAANSTTGKFHVARLTPIITIEVVDIWVGEVEVLNVTVNAPGSVNVTVYGITVEIPLDDGVMSTDVLQAAKAAYNGRATWNLINLPAGTYPAFAIYNGNENYSSVNTSDVFHVRARMSNVVVTAQDIYVGQDAIIKVNVGPTGVTGNVTIKVDGKSYNVNITDGKATINVPGLKAGEKSVEVIYNGDKIYSSSKNSTTFAVHKIKPQLVVDSVDIYVGENEPIVVTLPSDATGTVTITVDGVKYTAPVENGKATFDIPNLKAGKYAVDAVYSGDEKYLPTDGRDTFKVSKLKPDITINAPDITVGDNGVIKVTVPKDATGTITIEIEGKRYTQTIRNGEAVFIVPGLKVGVHDIKVYYSGDDKYLAGNTTGSIKVNPIKEDKNDTRHSPHVPVGLEKYETGNPIFILLLILLTFGSARLRRFRK